MRHNEIRLPREGGDPATCAERHWIPAFAGTTVTFGSL